MEKKVVPSWNDKTIYLPPPPLPGRPGKLGKLGKLGNLFWNYAAQAVKDTSDKNRESFIVRCSLSLQVQLLRLWILWDQMANKWIIMLSTINCTWRFIARGGSKWWSWWHDGWYNTIVSIQPTVLIFLFHLSCYPFVLFYYEDDLL